MTDYVFALDGGAGKRKGYEDWWGEVWLSDIFVPAFSVTAYPAGPIAKRFANFSTF